MEQVNKILSKSKNYIGVILFSLTIMMVSIPTFYVPWLTEIFADVKRNGQVLHWWSFLTSTFEHGLYLSTPTPNHWFLWVHMLTNLSILWVFGGKIEKTYGTNRFVLVSGIAFLTDTMVGAILGHFSRNRYSCGASGIVFSYIPFGIYFLFKNNQQGIKPLLLKIQKLVLLLWMLYLYGIITMVSGFQTFLFHLVSTLTGIACGIAFAKLDKTRPGKQKTSWWSIAILLIPILVIVVLYICIDMGKVKHTFHWM